MNKEHILNIAWNASQCLCGQLDYYVGIDNFFKYIEKILPIKSLIMGRFDQENFIQELSLLVTHDGIKKLAVKKQLTPAQIQLIEETNFFAITQTTLLYLKNKKSQFAPLYESSDKEIAKYNSFPILSYRVVDEKKVYGGIVLFFKEGTVITNEIMEIFQALKMPFTAFSKAFYLNKELSELTDISNQKQYEQTFPPHSANENIIGQKTGLKYLMNQVIRLAPLDITVLIRGETGTGKEVVARAIHTNSPLAGKPFIAVNCGAIPLDLIDSELFGHTKGSFTGAISDHKGFFEQADGGTLFLDEVAELPLSAQVKLLRVIQEKTVCKIGGNEETAVNFRLITATHRPLEEMIKLGTFREDLYYRINVVSLEIPPLRERKEDIPLLAEYFIKKISRQYNIVPPKVSESELKKLMDYPFPGNVRELQNMIIKQIALADKNELTFDFDSMIKQENNNNKAENNPADLIMSFDELMRKYLQAMLIHCKGKIDGAGGMAELTKLKNGTLRGKLNKYHIAYGKQIKKNISKNNCPNESISECYQELL